MVNLHDTESYVNKQKSKLVFCGALSFNPVDRLYALISTGTRIVADAKAKLRAAVISDEMEKVDLVDPSFPFSYCLYSVIYRLEKLGEYSHSRDGVPYSML